ncbi:MAG: ISAs1 family transposase [Candidatus Hydrogenedentes bacterium]|nr:ISAs1 family transposase [Candidatus Hydrogenedentota bacterium]
MDAKNLIDYFELIPDPRVNRTLWHKLPNVLFIALCAVLCGAEHWTHIEEYGKANEKWLRQFLVLRYGIPSHDTFGRIFAVLDPSAVEQSLRAFVRDFAGESAGKHIAMDGKTLRRSFDKAAEKNAIHMVTAWVYENHTSFGQIKVAEKSNEITAIPQLLDLLELKGATITIDAMGCQTAIAQKIVSADADYILALKGNQGTLHEEVSEFFDDVLVRGFDAELEYCHSIEKGHGRIEERTVWLSKDVNWLRDIKKWAGLNAIIAVESKRTINGNTSTERRHFIASGQKSVKESAQIIRQHWSIENELHWTLDVVFGEDLCRIRKGNAAENFSRIRRLALAILKKDTKAKVGIQGRRLKAAWNHNYLMKLLRI